MKTLRTRTVVLSGHIFAAGVATCQTWQPLNNQPTFSPGAVLLLTDGTVLAHSEPNCLTCTGTDYSSWYKLTPDSSGSHVNGTWTQVASPAGYAPHVFRFCRAPPRPRRRRGRRVRLLDWNLQCRLDQ